MLKICLFLPKSRYVYKLALKIENMHILAKSSFKL